LEAHCEARREYLEADCEARREYLEAHPFSAGFADLPLQLPLVNRRWNNAMRAHRQPAESPWDISMITWPLGLANAREGLHPLKLSVLEMEITSARLLEMVKMRGPAVLQRTPE